MIIWRGAGILAFVFFLLTGILGIGLPNGLGFEGITWWLLIPVGVLMVFATYVVGMRMNQWTPRERAEVGLTDLGERIEASLRDASFSLGPGHPRPRSLEEAQAQAAAYMDHARAQARQGFNRHTMFWIPLQHWAWVILLFALVASVGTALAGS